jgi:ribosome biogenesis protein BMS1
MLTLPNPPSACSVAQPIERKTRRFNSAPVPKKLQEALPFASKPKVASKRRAPTYLAKRAVVMEPEERKKHTMLQMVNTVRNDKLRIQREKQKERTAKLQKKRAAVEAFFKPHHNEERKRKFATESKEQVRRAEKLSRTGGGKRGD